MIINPLSLSERSMPKLTFALGSLFLVTGAAVASAQQPGLTVKEEEPGLLAKASISTDSATKVAQARIPKGTIQSAEIEMEDGHLIYSFDMKLPNKSGIDEVTVDAMTGRVLTVEHEDQP
jgi:uncharacterized membrane protein YkoI